MNSKQKGKRGELEFCSFLRDQGFEARRGQQYKGGGDSPDVVSDLPLPIHWEVKRTEAFRLWDALTQAKAEAGAVELPVVAHRRNRCEWVVVLRAEDFLSILREVDRG